MLASVRRVLGWEFGTYLRVVLCQARHESWCRTDLGFGFLFLTLDTDRWGLFSSCRRYRTYRHDASGRPGALSGTRRGFSVHGNACRRRAGYPWRLAYVRAV